MGSKGSNTTTAQSTPNPQAMQAYSDVLSRAQGVANLPYTAYSGELVAPVNQQQNLGISGINTYANAAQPYIQAGAAGVAANTQPISASQIQQYMSPYTQNVVNATQAQFANQNQQQQQQLLGNAIAQGALGGNRTAVAQAQLAGQQQLAQAPTIANLYNQGYGQAVQTALQEQGVGLQGSQALANLGIAGQTAGLQGAGQQVQAGTLQQQTQQALDQALLQQFQQQQAFPYQQAQWLAGIDTGVGSQMGGTSTTTLPDPSLLGQVAGGLTSGVGLLGASGAFGSSGWLAPAMAGLMLARGGRINSYAQGGVVGYDSGGGVAPMPYAGGPTYIPTMSISHGPGAPHAPAPYNYQNSQQAKDIGMVGNLAKQLQSSMSGSGAGTFSGPAYGGGSLAAGDAWGGSSANPEVGLTAADYGPGFKHGGAIGIAAFADGGTPTFDERFSPVYDAPLTSYDPNAPVNAGAPLQDVNPQAVQDWRNSVDKTSPQLTPKGVAPTDSEDAGVSAATPAPASAPVSYPMPQGIDTSGQSTGVAAPVQQPTDRWGSDSKLWPALISAGFGMLASRSPFPGVAIGEGGQAGVASWNAQQQQDLEARKFAAQQDIAQRQEALREQEAKREQMAAPLIPDGKGGMIINPAYLALKQQVAAIEQKDKFVPIGSVISGEASHPLIMNQASGAILDATTGKPPLPNDRVVAAGIKGMADPGQVAHIVNSIVTGKQPPTLSGLYGTSKDVRAGLDEKGFDLSKALLEWNAAQKQVSTLNGPQMLRFVGLARSVTSTIDEVRELSKELNNSGIPVLNRAKLFEYMQMEGNSPRGQLAAAYIGAVNTLKEEFANLANGGYAPTEAAWKLANDQINGNYGVNQLGASLTEVQRLINYRVNAIPGLSTSGPGAANRYTGQTAAPAATPAPAPQQAVTKPSLQEFLAKAKPANPNKSERELTDYYFQTYGTQ